MPQTPPYRIETDRLVIRCWQPSDAAMMKSAVNRSKEHLLPWLPWAKFEPQTLDEKVELCRTFRSRFDREEDYVYAIFNKDETEVLGGTGLHTRRGPHAFEIGYWVNVDHIGKGIATEASKVMTILGLDYCKRDRMEIHCDPENLRSTAIPRKIDYTWEVTRRRLNPGVEEGEMVDIMIWTLLRSEFGDWAFRDLPIKAWDAAGRQVI